MDKRLLLIVFILLLNSVFAEIDAVEIGEGILSDQDPEIIKAQEQAQQFSAIIERINTASILTLTSLEASINYLDGRITQMKSESIIVTIIIGLAFSIGNWAVYLFLKSKKLI